MYNLCGLLPVISLCIGVVIQADVWHENRLGHNATNVTSVELQTKVRSRRLRQAIQLITYNPLLERQWTLPIKYFFEGTLESSARDSIRKAFAYWESMTCARFQEVTDRSLITSTLNSRVYLAFTANRVAGKRCVRNIFARKYVGSTTNPRDIYRMVDGCLTLSATKEGDVGSGSLFYFYLNEQLPPFADDFLEAIDETRSGSQPPKILPDGKFPSKEETLTAYQLPGLSFSQFQSVNDRYCKDCSGGGSDHCQRGCSTPSIQIYTNGGCDQKSPPVDAECNLNKTVTSEETCISSPPLEYRLPGSHHLSFCPYRLQGRDGCRVRMTYEGDLRTVTLCKNGPNLKAISCDNSTRISVSGSLLSTGSSATIVFRSRYDPSNLVSPTRNDSGLPPIMTPPGDRRKKQFYLRFNVCFRLFCDGEEPLEGRSTRPPFPSPSSAPKTPAARPRQPRVSSRGYLDMRLLLTETQSDLVSPVAGMSFEWFNMSAKKMSDRDQDSDDPVVNKNFVVGTLIALTVLVVAGIGVAAAYARQRPSGIIQKRHRSPSSKTSKKRHHRST